MENVTFKVGDHVVYPSQGAGVIKEKTTREIAGETQEYLKIIFVKGDMEVLVPLKKGADVGLRHTVSAGEVAQLYEAIAKGETSLPSQWTPRYRAEQEILSGGDAFTLASMIGTLAARDFEKGLAATERQIMEDAKGLLASEIAVTESLSLQEATAKIDEVISQALET
ncbi:MAG: CarD family transcriptional regulator [Deinococcota bacterium]|jgi:CarD family transcriptional regulator|nr:CarD family transcriptional regulator [Deinococcota bacterium]